MSRITILPEHAASPGRRAIELMQMAKAAGEAHVASLLQTLELAADQAQEIADGGEIYPAGVRDLAARLAEHNAHQARTIHAIMGAARPRPAFEALVQRSS